MYAFKRRRIDAGMGQRVKPPHFDQSPSFKTLFSTNPRAEQPAIRKQSTSTGAEQQQADMLALRLAAAGGGRGPGLGLPLGLRLGLRLELRPGRAPDRLAVRWQRAGAAAAAARLAVVSQEDGAKYKRAVYSVSPGPGERFRVDKVHEGALTAWPTGGGPPEADGDAAGTSSARQAAQQAWNVLWDMFMPKDAHVSVTRDYFPYAKWFFFSSVVSSAAGVLSMQSLLYAIGLGAGSIPTAAAVNWVLKDGVGQFGGVIFARCVLSCCSCRRGPLTLVRGPRSTTAWLTTGTTPTRSAGASRRPRRSTSRC